ncbi:MAG: ABC transporter ATP-binding protein [Actinomycetota bacterium]|nr:ABC transporter ATP-binding protein [Actinomycetota bacterium]MDA8284759.1 ABC transporter ATP-binding protein [Actinomycetota bacterium]
MTFGLDAVTVRYGRQTALDAVSLAVEPGRVSAVVGGDGAGKSTALAALVGLINPADGLVRRPAKTEIGYVPATAGHYGDLTVEENLLFTAQAFRMAPGERDARMNMLLEQTGLQGARRRLGGQLSGGMQRKLAVAMALVHNPKLLVLDEPTTGVDPLSRVDLWRLISQAAAGGVAVAVATTYVNEAARATTIALLSSGRALAAGSPDAILTSIPGTLGATTGRSRPTDRSWRRGAMWRVWVPNETLPDGVEGVSADFEDAVVVAELAAAEVSR